MSPPLCLFALLAAAVRSRDGDPYGRGGVAKLCIRLEGAPEKELEPDTTADPDECCAGEKRTLLTTPAPALSAGNDEVRGTFCGLNESGFTVVGPAPAAAAAEGPIEWAS